MAIIAGKNRGVGFLCWFTCKEIESMTSFLLFEAASGYALFARMESEEIGAMQAEVIQAQSEKGRFSKLVQLRAFQPFVSAEQALENQNDISEGILNATLKLFLEVNLDKPKPGKLTKYSLGVSDTKIGQAVQEEMSIKCESDELVLELLRGIRYHFSHYISALRPGDMERAQLGLAHSYSRAKVKFNVNRVDNMVIQAIALLDQLDKDVNTFSMRCREWFSWHFPELVRVIPDNTLYALAVRFIQRRSNLSEQSIPGLTEVLDSEDLARDVLEASKSSMGTDISDIDMVNIQSFADRVVSINKYRVSLHNYLIKKMNSCAPNLSALIGELVGARLISHAGSLTNLAKYPASTIQILGAEKALFRALKTKGNTPKYGLIYHSTFIGRAAVKNKGRVSRFLANKCAIASRIDCFSDSITQKFGDKLREQVEERLKFYDTGATPRKNLDVMRLAIDEVNQDNVVEVAIEHKKKRKSEAAMDVDVVEESVPKKKKKASIPVAVEIEAEQLPLKKKKEKKAEVEEETEIPKKKKEKKAQA